VISYDFRNAVRTARPALGYAGAMPPARKVDSKWIRERIKEVHESQSSFARALGIGAPRVVELLEGSRRLQIREAFVAGEFLKVPIHEIYRAFAVNPPKRGYGKLLVSGYIDATSGAITVRADVVGDRLDEIDAPFPGYEGSVARIHGTSMAPRFRDGEIIAFSPGLHDIRQLLNTEVVAELEDGRILLKTLHKGNQDNLYTITSLNPDDPPIVNVAVRWAAPIDFHIPRRP
jgi:hypothetical protein